MGKVKPAKTETKAAGGNGQLLPVEVVPIDSLREHPRNYRQHPDDQLEHLVESLTRYGWYRNVVIARDGTILAGHGIVKAARKMGRTEIPVRRLDIDPDDSSAHKVIIGDNEVANLAMVDDRMLTEMLKGISESDLNGLLGTGYDVQQFAALVMITRPTGEIADFNAAAEWIGMPECSSGINTIKLVVSFRNEGDLREFSRRFDIALTDRTRDTYNVWWPPKERQDIGSVCFEG